MSEIRTSNFEFRKKARENAKGVILPVVLFVLVLIGLLAAMFSFRVNADLASTQAVAMRLQTRLAAEAGVEYVRMVLRTSRFDRTIWYNNPEIFNRIIVTAHDRDAKTAGTNQEFEENMVYRFSIVADDPTDDKDYIRFGITDEASKLNLNEATEPQLLALVTAALGENTEVDPQTIVDAILDWKDTDAEPRGEEGDTERTYYSALAKPYRVKNGPFDTVEELLLVKGVTPAILYGEDFDRNGLITENEKDGDRTFPADNQDDFLNRGLYAYLTVISKENNVANDNRPRIYLRGTEETVRTELAAVFPDEPDVVEYIVTTSKAPPAQGGDGGGGGAGPGGGRKPGTQQGQQGEQAGQEGAGEQQTGSGPQTGQLGGAGGTGSQQGGAGNPPMQGGSQGGAQGGTNPPPSGRSGAGPAKPGKPKGPKKQKDGQQPTGSGAQPQSAGGQSGQQGQGTQQGSGQQGAGQQGSEQQGTGQQGTQQEGTGDAEQGPKTPDGGGEGGEGGESGEGQAENPPITSPASLLLPRTVDGQQTPSPLPVEHLAVLMDRTTMVNPEERTIPGLININTAPPAVLACLEGLTEEHIQGIMANRDALDAKTLSTTAWLVSEGVMDIVAYEKVAPHITARGQQFTIESVGYADHMGMVTRLQVVVDMNGPIAQTVYYRDISNLGGSFPIRESDKDKIRGR